MVNWIPIKVAITPTENSVVPDGVWSGGATTDVNGVPVLFFTAGNDSFAESGLISNQNFEILLFGKKAMCGACLSVRAVQ